MSNILFLLAAGLVIMALVVKFSIKNECINGGATVITLLLLVLYAASMAE